MHDFMTEDDNENMSIESTTLGLPSDLLAAVDKAICEGHARNRDELVESALRRELTKLRRAALDAEFVHMKDDADYRTEAFQILADFAQSDWEALPEESQPRDNGR